MSTSIEWIASSDRLPDEDTRVLVALDGDVWGATYHDACSLLPAHWLTDDASVVVAQRVAHWCHVPEVP